MEGRMRAVWPQKPARSDRTMETYSIPVGEDRYLVYRPLRPLAFVTNGRLVNRLVKSLDIPHLRSEEGDDDVADFLEEVGMLAPDRMPPAEEDIFRLPTTGVLCLTTACNLRCTYCFAEGGEKVSEHLSRSAGLRVIDQVHRNARTLGEDSFAISFHGGGEPTVAWERLTEFIGAARSKDLATRISLTSNGYWSDAQRHWILGHVDEVSLSFDGPAEIQNAQRPTASGRPSFSTVFKTIDALDRSGKKYGIRMTVTDASVSRLPETLHWLCTETACAVFQVEPAFAAGRALRNSLEVHEPSVFVRQFLNAYDVALQYGRHLYYSGARPWVITTRFCEASRRALIVRPDGTLTRCYEISDRLHPLNRLFEVGRIRDDLVELSPDAGLELERRLGKRRRACRDCFNFWHCAGDCPAKSMGSTEGEHDGSDDRCDMNREITKGLLLRYVAHFGGVWRGQLPSGAIGAG